MALNTLRAPKPRGQKSPVARSHQTHTRMPIPQAPTKARNKAGSRFTTARHPRIPATILHNLHPRMRNLEQVKDKHVALHHSLCVALQSPRAACLVWFFSGCCVLFLVGSRGRGSVLKEQWRSTGGGTPCWFCLFWGGG